MQIATLMQLQSSRADPAQLERLQFMLSDKNNEIESLMMKVRELEKEKVSLPYTSSIEIKHYSLRNMSNNSATNRRLQQTNIYMSRLKKTSLWMRLITQTY